MADEFLHGLLAQLVSHHPLLRLEEAAQLSRLGDPRAVPALVDRLSDVDNEVRISVVQALASIGGREVAARLVPLLSVEQVGLRNTAIEALATIGDQVALESLLAVMRQGDELAHTAIAAARSLQQASGGWGQAAGSPGPGVAPWPVSQQNGI